MKWISFYTNGPHFKSITYSVNTLHDENPRHLSSNTTQLQVYVPTYWEYRTLLLEWEKNFTVRITSIEGNLTLANKNFIERTFKRFEYTR